MESFGVLLRRVGFDATQPKERIERIFREPLFASLGRKPFHEALHFLITQGLRQWNKHVWLAEIAVILRNLVFKNLMSTEGIPGQLGYNAVILMKIMSIVGKDQFWIAH